MPVHTLPKASVPGLSGVSYSEERWADIAWDHLDDPLRLRPADGSNRPIQPTDVTLCHDGDNLFVRFQCHDTDIWGTYTERDDPIYDEEVVEVFLAPGVDVPTRYYEFEVSPNGVLLDALIDSPTGRREQMKADFEWNLPGIEWASERNDLAQRWQAWLKIPLKPLLTTRRTPALWRAAFYRIERPRGLEPEFSCWSPTYVEPPDFHVPARFGFLELEGLTG